MQAAKKNYLLLCAFYFFKVGSIGIFIPFFQVYLNYLHYNKFQIGVLTSLFAISLAGMPIVWGRLASKLAKPHYLAASLVVASSLFLFMLLQVHSFWGVFWVVLGAMVPRAGVIPIMEHYTQSYCHQYHWHYGRIRMWGTLGFAVAVILGGYCIEKWGADYFVYLMVVLGAFVAWVLIQLPTIQDLSDSPHPFNLHQYWPKIFYVTLLACFFMQVSHGAYYGFFSLYLKSLHLQETWVGYFWFPSMLAEMAIMFLLAPYLRHFAPKNILIFSLVMALLRWTILSLVQVPSIIFFSQILHAFSYGSFHLAMMELIKQEVPHDDQHLGQGFYTSITYGVGNVVGFILQGKLGDHYSYATMFGVSAILALVGLVIMVIVSLRNRHFVIST